MTSNTNRPVTTSGAHLALSPTGIWQSKLRAILIVLRHPATVSQTTDVIRNMEITCLDTGSPGVRTVLHMSPAVMAAAIVSAQKCGLNLREWLDRAVASLIADDHPESAAPWSVQAADLFADVASGSPELLRGQWALLYERVQLERDLWHQPELTPEEATDDELPGAPYIVPARLRKAWPRLVAGVFCL